MRTRRLDAPTKINPGKGVVSTNYDSPMEDKSSPPNGGRHMVAAGETGNAGVTGGPEEREFP